MGAVKHDGVAALSPREQQVLELLAKGSAYKEIAHQLSISIETVRMNVKHIYAMLHVHCSRAHPRIVLKSWRFSSGRVR